MRPIQAVTFAAIGGGAGVGDADMTNKRHWLAGSPRLSDSVTTGCRTGFRRHDAAERAVSDAPAAVFPGGPDVPAPRELATMTDPAGAGGPGGSAGGQNLVPARPARGPRSRPVNCPELGQAASDFLPDAAGPSGGSSCFRAGPPLFARRNANADRMPARTNGGRIIAHGTRAARLTRNRVALLPRVHGARSEAARQIAPVEDRDAGPERRHGEGAGRGHELRHRSPARRIHDRRRTADAEQRLLQDEQGSINGPAIPGQVGNGEVNGAGRRGPADVSGRLHGRRGSAE